MRVGAIDESATLGRSWLHETSPKAKLVAFALLLAAVVVTWNLLVVFALLIALVAVVMSAGLRPRLAYGLAAYPAVFALVFALSSAPSVVTGAVIVLKAVTAALAAVVVILTTPYPYVFAPLQRVVPGIVGDALLMTYRSTFLLLEKLSNLLRAVRLRSGLRFGHPIRAAQATTRSLGALLLYSLDLARRDYDVMRLRGYSGRLRVTPPKSASPVRDAALVATAAVLLATSGVWRVAADALNPYSWLPTLSALILLAVAIVARWRTT
ncbi:MAG: energy-coupling factor transporter transmembrane protein EcfT [Coriobacteriia bacterium]|nr:energy-coupling factor transporter transmembrane protein EcfT [Coriobacteriia bacterium]